MRACVLVCAWAWACAWATAAAAAAAADGRVCGCPRAEAGRCDCAAIRADGAALIAARAAVYAPPVPLLGASVEPGPARRNPTPKIAATCCRFHGVT